MVFKVPPAEFAGSAKIRARMIEAVFSKVESAVNGKIPLIGCSSGQGDFSSV
jgi:hypothetical protein